MSVSILRDEKSSRHVRHNRRHLLRKVTRFKHIATRVLANASGAPKDASFQTSSTAGLLALYGLPFPMIINP